MKRVLYITDSLKQRFGVTSVIMNYITHFDFTNMRIDVLAYEDSETEIVDKINALGCKVFFMPTLGLKSILSYRQFITEFFEVHRDEYDIVHSHFNQIDGIVFPIAKKYGAKACISHSHNTKWSESSIKAVRNKIMCLPQKYVATHWFACSKLAGEFMFGKAFNTSPKAWVLKNAIDCTQFHYNTDVRDQMRNKLGVSNKTVLGFVGSFKKQKNPSFVLDVYSDLIKQDPSTKGKYCLFMVGAGPIEDEVHQKVNDLGLNQNDVKFLGRRSDVSDLLQAFDILLLPSLYEGLPVTLIEAQITGIKSIVSDTITREVTITPNIEYLPITQGTGIWCEAIRKTSIDQRESKVKDAIAAGYEINNAAKVLENYYLNILRKQ